MGWIITLPIGILIGIMFSVAFPGVAQGINDSIYPTIQGIFSKGIDIAVDVGTDAIFNKTGGT